jgi:hypothetical protein
VSEVPPVLNETAFRDHLDALRRHHRRSQWITAAVFFGLLAPLFWAHQFGPLNGTRAREVTVAVVGFVIAVGSLGLLAWLVFYSASRPRTIACAQCRRELNGRGLHWMATFKRCPHCNQVPYRKD